MQKSEVRRQNENPFFILHFDFCILPFKSAIYNLQYFRLMISD